MIAAIQILMFTCTRVATGQARLSYKCRTQSVNFFISSGVFSVLHVCFGISFVGEKVFFCHGRHVIVSFEKSSNLDSMKLCSTNVCLWKSTQTVLHSKYRFCSKNANQTGHTSTLLVHCLKQCLAISCGNG